MQNNIKNIQDKSVEIEFQLYHINVKAWPELITSFTKTKHQQPFLIQYSVVQRAEILLAFHKHGSWAMGENW